MPVQETTWSLISFCACPRDCLESDMFFVPIQETTWSLISFCAYSRDYLVSDKFLCLSKRLPGVWKGFFFCLFKRPPWFWDIFLCLFRRLPGVWDIFSYLRDYLGSEAFLCLPKRLPGSWDIFVPIQDFSLVQSLDRFGHHGDMRDDSAEILFRSFLQEALVGSSGLGRDVHSLMLSI